MEEFEEMVVWNGNINHVRAKMKELEIEFGKKITFPVYFRDKTMILPGGDEVEYGSEVYLSIEEGVPTMMVAMPRSHRNINVRLIMSEE